MLEGIYFKRNLPRWRHGYLPPEPCRIKLVDPINPGSSGLVIDKYICWWTLNYGNGWNQEQCLVDISSFIVLFTFFQSITSDSMCRWGWWWNQPQCTSYSNTKNVRTTFKCYHGFNQGHQVYFRILHKGCVRHIVPSTLVVNCLINFLLIINESISISISMLQE